MELRTELARFAQLTATSVQITNAMFVKMDML
jgi:hypothetical protein